MVSWSLLTVHTTPAIDLQLMLGLYNSQQRPLTSKKTPKILYRKCPGFVFQKSLTIWFGLHNPDQGYFWFICRVREKQTGWEM